MWSRREKMRPWRLKTGVLSLATDTPALPQAAANETRENVESLQKILSSCTTSGDDVDSIFSSVAHDEDGIGLHANLAPSLKSVCIQLFCTSLEPKTKQRQDADLSIKKFT